MSFNDFMAKVRYLDNLTAKWMMRHFYFMFFQIVLVVIFFFWFVNTINLVDLSTQAGKTTKSERILISQAANTNIIVLLMLLNSFWMLFIFNSIIRIKAILKEASYYLSKIRLQNK